MVDKIVRHAENLALEEDFEWVNAWAASTIREDLEPEPTNHAAPEPVRIDAPGGQASSAVTLAPASKPGSSDTAAMTAADDLANAAAAGADDASKEAYAPPAALPIAPHLEHGSSVAQASDDRAEVPDIAAGDETAAMTLANMEEAAPSAGPRPAVRTWMGRKPWRNVFRIVARNPDPPAFAADADVAAQQAPTVPCVEVETEASPPERGEADLMRVPDQIVLASDQFERDIAEIELIRDRLLAEPTDLDRRFVAASTPPRTSDHVPILVGGALAFTMLVVFGAAASLVSLR